MLTEEHRHGQGLFGWGLRGRLKPLWLRGTETTDLYALTWPALHIGEAIAHVARHAKLFSRPLEDVPPPPSVLDLTTLHARERWLQACAGAVGLEAEPTQTSYAQAEQLVRHAGPALLQIPDPQDPQGLLDRGQPRFLVLLKGGWRHVVVFGPDGTKHRIASETVRTAWCATVDVPHQDAADQLLDTIRIPQRRRRYARRAILDEQLGTLSLHGCWLLRLSLHAPLWAHIRQARLPSTLALFLGAALVEQIFIIAAWMMIGQQTLAGRPDWVWLVCWVLLLLSATALLALATLAQGRFATSAGGVFKQRLLQGAFQLEPEEVRHQGVGQFLGQVMESEAVELLGLAEGLLAVFALIQLGIATVILTLGAGGWPHAFLLVGWTAVAGLLGWRYWRQARAWGDVHLRMANNLVEQMLGYRTRLAQTAQADWHETEDQMLERYFQLSQKMDRALGQFITLVPRGGMAIVGIAGLIPALLVGQQTSVHFVISLGGIFLALQAWLRLTTGIQGIIRAALAWKQIRPLFQAANRPAASLSNAGMKSAQPDGVSEPSQAVLTVRNLAFRYTDKSRFILQACNLQVHHGDRLLLEGPSGGGKSTLAAVLAGLRSPESGLLLLRGADQYTLGTTDWRRRVVSVPQFHENHIFTGTLAFNLLMGRCWPPRPDDLVEAEAVCRELGLGELIERMPAGMGQMVGESGWQLSHGERSRVYLARALLQSAEMVICDESFGALDPHNLSLALRCALRRAPTLLVIAHP